MQSGSSCQNPTFGQMTCGAPVGTLGDLVFEERGERPRGRPALGVGNVADAGPQPGDGGQTQLGEEQRQAGGVGSEGHAAISMPVTVSSWS